MANYPRILNADANRIAEHGIRVRVQAEVSDMATSTLWESHEVSGDRLLVTIYQAQRERANGESGKPQAGFRELDLQIAPDSEQAQGIRYVDIYGGDYDHENARRVILPWRRQ